MLSPQSCLVELKLNFLDPSILESVDIPALYHRDELPRDHNPEGITEAIRSIVERYKFEVEALPRIVDEEAELAKLAESVPETSKASGSKPPKPKPKRKREIFSDDDEEFMAEKPVRVKPTKLKG